VRPPARSVHAACCIAGPLTEQEHPLLMVVGGYDGGVCVLGDVWLLDVDKGIWTEVGRLNLSPITTVYVVSKLLAAVANLSAPTLRHSWKPYYCIVLVIATYSIHMPICCGLHVLQVILPEPITPRDCHSATEFGSGSRFIIVVLFGGKELPWRQYEISETTLLSFGKYTFQLNQTWCTCPVIAVPMKHSAL